MVDRNNYDRLENFRWVALKEANGATYAASFDYPDPKVHTAIRLHRYLLNAPKSKMVDHKNMNPLDNRVANLRLCNKSQNAMNQGLPKNNTSGYKGVFYNKRACVKKWWAYIWVNNKRVSLGCYMTKEEAASARISAMFEYHGEFGRID